jgi:hypothetical protein
MGNGVRSGACERRGAAPCTGRFPGPVPRRDRARNQGGDAPILEPFRGPTATGRLRPRDGNDGAATTHSTAGAARRPVPPGPILEPPPPGTVPERAPGGRSPA